MSARLWQGPSRDQLRQSCLAQVCCCYLCCGPFGHLAVTDMTAGSFLLGHGGTGRPGLWLRNKGPAAALGFPHALPWSEPPDFTALRYASLGFLCRSHPFAPPFSFRAQGHTQDTECGEPLWPCSWDTTQSHQPWLGRRRAGWELCRQVGPLAWRRVPRGGNNGGILSLAPHCERADGRMTHFQSGVAVMGLLQVADLHIHVGLKLFKTGRLNICILFSLACKLW